jgi:hypothetical protein
MSSRVIYEQLPLNLAFPHPKTKESPSSLSGKYGDSSQPVVLRLGDEDSNLGWLIQSQQSYR